MPATLIDVARHAGVSLATASRVLNGSTRSVTPALRQRVLDAALALAYVANAHAQALARASTATIGVIVHDMSDPYFSEILRGVQQVTSARERLVMVCNSYRDPERELAYVTLLQSQRVEALVLAGSGLDDRHAMSSGWPRRSSRLRPPAGGRCLSAGTTSWATRLSPTTPAAPGRWGGR